MTNYFKKWFSNEPVVGHIDDLGWGTKDCWALKNDDLGRDLLGKANYFFQGTAAEIDMNRLGRDQEIKNLSMLNRMALNTAIQYDDAKDVIEPISPIASDYLFREGKFEKDSSEHLALLLYDTEGDNAPEANALLASIREHKKYLGLTNYDFSKRLIVVNAGLEKEMSMPHGVKPIVIENLTEVYSHETLDFSDKDYNFVDAFDRGLPHFDDLGNGGRILKTPEKDKDIGLRVLVRQGEHVLNAAYSDLRARDPNAGMYVGPRPPERKWHILQEK